MVERILPIEEEPQFIPKPKPEEEEGDDLSDLFEVPKQGYEKEDISDLFEVTEEDVMGVDEEAEEEEEQPEEPSWADEDIKRYQQSLIPQPTRKPLFKRTAKRYIIPQPGIGGVRE